MSSTPRRCPIAVGLVEDFTHGHLRELGNVFSPRMWPRSLGGERRSRLGRDVHQGLVFVPHGFAGANRRRPKCPSRAHVHRRRLQLFCQQPSTQQLAQPFMQPCHRAPGRPVSALKFVRSGGDQARSFNVESPGPALRTSARVAPRRSLESGLRWAGGGSHRLAVPGRGRCLLTDVPTGSSVTPTRSKRSGCARCWTQRRQPAGSSRR